MKMKSLMSDEHLEYYAVERAGSSVHKTGSVVAF
jgi:hypothetical protein